MNEKYIIIENSKFYYTEVALYHGRKIIDRVIAKKNLQLFHSIIKSTNIRYGLMFGTLLGAIREKDFIVHDEDIDIFLLEEDRQTFMKLLFLFKEAGLLVIRVTDDIISLMRNDEYIDVYFFKKKRTLWLEKMRICQNTWSIDAQSMENPINIDFLGMEIPIPSEPEKILFKLYGANWKIPLEGKNAEGNTVYSWISSRFPFIKTLPLFSFIKQAYNKYF